MKPYVPDALPLTGLDYRLLLPLVGQANAALARYDGLLQGIHNPTLMLSPLTTQEAVLSSKIEGTQATVDEVLEQEAGLLGRELTEADRTRIARFIAHFERITRHMMAGGRRADIEVQLDIERNVTEVKRSPG